MGSVGSNISAGSSSWISEDDFMREAERQGVDGQELQGELEDYVESSYGGVSLGDKLSNFIENMPPRLMYGDGTLYRGLMFNSEEELQDFLNSHKPGATLKTRRDGLSWSADHSIAEEFSTNASDQAVILVNNDKNRLAMGIKNIADTPMSSSEVLFSNKVDFKVSKVERKNGIVYMHVEQKRKR